MLDGSVDFGEGVTTRAVRLRVVEQWSTKDHYPSGVRSDRGGSGLGLAIVQQIAVTHGGRIQAANHPDGGAVMELLLPARA